MNRIYYVATLAALWSQATIAAEPPADSCRDAFKTVLDGSPKKDDWKNGILDHLHDALYRFNNVETADVEMVFCRLATIMEVKPDLSALPQTITKTDPNGGTVTVTVTAPTEAFATAAGYVAKAEIKSGETVFLTVWWAGSETSSKGYLIQGSNPMETDGNKRLKYVQWDRIGETQLVKILATQFATSYLTTPKGSATSKTGGDKSIYARLSYNTATKAVAAQSIEIRQGKTAETESEFRCVRTNFSGTLGGAISGFRPAKGTPELVSETSTGGASETTGGGLDGETGLIDAKTTADHSGIAVAGTELASGTFDVSCADIDGASSAGEPFASNQIVFTTTPADIWPK